MVLVTLICCFQSDLKRLVAYSSVSHIITIPLIYLRSNLLSVKGLLILIFMHGIRSPLMFMVVGLVYGVYSSRQFMLVRGFLLLRPLVSLMIVLGFFLHCLLLH